MFNPIKPDKDDMEAYIQGYFPMTLLGNHIKWAANFLDKEFNCSAGDSDCYPKYRLWIVQACKKYLEENKE